MDWQTVKVIYEQSNHGGSSESLVIQRNASGQFRKVRFQCDQGTGSDNIVLRPGESIRGYSFTHEEANEAQKSWAKMVKGDK